jgi:hypothetical protein
MQGDSSGLSFYLGSWNFPQMLIYIIVYLYKKIVLIHPHKQGGLSLSLSIYLPANANLWRHLVRERRKMASRLVHFINGFPTWCCHNWVRVWLLTAYLVFCGVFVFVLLFSILMLPF